MFDASIYSPEIQYILGDGNMPMPLGPGVPKKEYRSALMNFDPFRDLGNLVSDRDMASACHSALWLYHNYLDESHTISQDLHTPTGSMLHAIMHRREPDASNSKYWWRRVGHHPVLNEMNAVAKFLQWRLWDTDGFVDLCEKHRGTGSEHELLLQQLQLMEWQKLFAYCRREAISS